VVKAREAKRAIRRLTAAIDEESKILRRMHQEKDEHEGVLHSANAAAVLVRFNERDVI